MADTEARDDKMSETHDVKMTLSNDQGSPAEVHSLTPAQSRRMLLKTDLVVTPLAVISMTLAFLDKVCWTKDGQKMDKRRDEYI